MSEEIQSWDVDSGVSIATTVVTRQQMNSGTSLNVPSWARCIEKVSLVLANVTPTAAESVICKLTLETMPGIAPYDVPFPPLNAILGDISEQSGGYSLANTWDVNAPCGGGEKLDAYIQSLSSSAGVIKASIGIKYSSAPPKAPQLHSVMGTATSTTTAVGEAAGTAYTIANVARIREFFGIVAGTTMDVNKPIIGNFRFLSSGFPITPVKLPAEPVPGTVKTSGGPQIWTSRKSFSIPTNPICVIQDYFNLQVAVTTAGKFVTGVMYEARS